MGLRSAGRSTGREVGAPGRGRWKIGWPGTGRPGTERAGAAGPPAEAVGEAGLIGALYTGRGPVCGTIKRGRGTCGEGALGVAGLAVAVVCADAGAVV